MHLTEPLYGTIFLLILQLKKFREKNRTHPRVNLLSQGSKIDDTHEWLEELSDEVHKIDQGYVN